MKKRLVPFFLLLFVPPVFGTATDVADPHWTSTGAISYGGMNILAHPSDPTRLYARSGRPYFYGGSYSGPEMFRSTDAGRTFTSPRAPSREDLLLLDPWNPDVLWGSSTLSLVRSTDGGDTWSPVAINLPSIPFRQVVATLATRPTTLLLTVDRFCFGPCSGGGLYKSTNGSDWTYVALGDRMVYRVFTDPRYPSLIYATVDNYPMLLRSTNGGSTWETMGSSSPNLPLLVAVDPLDPNTIYGIHNELYKSSDAGRTWTNISDGLPVNDYYGPTVQACVVDPTNPAHLYVAMNGEVGVHHSTDGGATWKPLVGGAGVRFAQSLAVDPTGQGLYAGTMVLGSASALGQSPRGAVFRWTTSGFSRILPSAASIHGVNGAFFHSDVRVFNPSPTSPVDVTARYSCFAGSCDGAPRSFTVKPREQMVFDDIVANFLQAPESAGPIEFSSVLPILVTSRAYTPAKPAPTIGQFVPSLTLDDAAHEAVLTSLSHSADQAVGSRTNIGIVGPFEAKQTISIELYDSSARKLGSVSRLLPAQQAIQINDSDLSREAGISGDVPDFYAVVRGEGLWPFFAYATVIDNVTQDSIFIAGRNP